MLEDDKGCPMIRLGVSEWVFLLVLACSGCPGQKLLNGCVCVLVCIDLHCKIWYFWNKNLISGNDGGGAWGDPILSIMKFKNTRIPTKSKTLYPHEKCRTYVNKTIFARQCHSYYSIVYLVACLFDILLDHCISDTNVLLCCCSQHCSTFRAFLQLYCYWYVHVPTFVL